MEISNQNNINKAPFLHISKLEAAKRQLEMAIRLYFNHEDLVVIHSLTWAAHNLLSDLGKNQEVRAILDSVADIIIPERRSEFKKMIRKAGNYFKHADNDPDELLKFYFKTTDIYLLDACKMYQALTKESTPLIVVFRMWYHLSTPGVLDTKNEEILDNARRLFYKSEGRTKFFADMLPIAMAEDKSIKK